MSDWLRGRPYASSPFEVKRDSQQRMEQLAQDGWTIAYLAYYDNGLPERLRITRADEIDLRLVIEDWRPGAPE